MRLTTSRVLASGQTQQFGDVIEVDPGEAKRLLAEGQAVPVATKRETATAARGEQRNQPNP